MFLLTSLRALISAPTPVPATIPVKDTPRKPLTRQEMETLFSDQLGRKPAVLGY